HIKKAAIGRSRYLRGRIPAGMAIRDCADDLPLLDLAILCGPSIDRHGRIQLIVHVEHRQARVKGRMAGRCTWAGNDRALGGGRDPAIAEAKEEGPVEALVRDDDELASRIKDDGVRM